MSLVRSGPSTSSSPFLSLEYINPTLPVSTHATALGKGLLVSFSSSTSGYELAMSLFPAVELVFLGIPAAEFFKDQRLNCWQIEIQLPKKEGRSRQGNPVRIRYKIPSPVFRKLGLS